MRRMIWIALVVTVFLFASTEVSQARPNNGRGGRGAHGGGRVVSPPAVQPHVGARGRQGFIGHRDGHGHRGGHGGVFLGVTPFVIGPAFAYGWPYGGGYVDPSPAYPAPTYWYYCPSAGAYYPDVPSCPEPWVPVPAQ
jgi:hypothetical protein